MTEYAPTEPYEPAEGPVSFRDYPMRLGSKLGRTLYLKTGDGDKCRDTVAGMVDSVELAAEIMEAVNYYYGHDGDKR